MKNIRILLTSVGRRVELVQAFKRAAERLNIALTIYGADLTDTAPALYFCDRKVRTPRISSPTYISELQSVCIREKIDCLIPTIDTDLFILSQKKDEFKVLGTQVLISAEDKIRLCRDKRLTSSFFVECSLLAPMPVDAVEKYSSGFPAFIKPKDGSSSINAFRVDSQADLEARALQVFDYIIQPFVEGTEYTVDIFCDFMGNPIYITPRERIAVRSGEVLKTLIFQDETIIAGCQKIIEKFKPCGPLTVQLIRQKDTGKDYYIEINPRFGGGAPLSMKAGADSAEALLRLLGGETVDYMPLAATDGAVYSRFDQSVCTSDSAAPGNKPPIKAVIFDLDDTLYSEKDYVRSGFRAVAERLNGIVDHAFDKLWSAFEAGQPAIDTVLSEAGMPDLKDECVSVYRSHSPQIALYQGVPEMLESLRSSGIKLGIITDGRPEGQRAKIEALGLAPLVDSIIVTDELGGVEFRKPCDIAFRIMQRKLGVPYESMVYVGDNPTKDFIAPANLGMQSVWFINSEGLNGNKGGSCVPGATIDSITDLVCILYSNMQKICGGLNAQVEASCTPPSVDCDRQSVQPILPYRNLLIVGAGGHGRVIADIARLSNRYDQIGFLDDADINYSGGIKVICKIADADRWADKAEFVIAVGDNGTREKIASKLDAVGVRYALLVHPSSIIAESVEIGAGSVVMANVVVNTGSKVGRHCIINTGATVDHDCGLDDFVHLSPGVHLSGTVKIGSISWLGVGAAVTNNVNICGGCTIGAGAVVIKDIETAGTYVGVPAIQL